MVRSLLFALVLPLAACFSDASPADTDSAACELGALGCECFGNETCLEDLVCNASVKHCVRENCSPGESGCVCDAGSCADGLVCSDGMVCGGGATTTTATTMATGGMTGSTTLPQTTTTTTTSSQSTGLLDSSSSGRQAGPVTLYFGGGQASLFSLTNGTARAAADTICAAAQPMGVACSESVALISDDQATVTTLGVPLDGVVLNGAGGTVAASFASFLSSGADNGLTLRAAGVEFVMQEDGQAVNYATGTSPDGALAETCENWSSSAAGSLLTVGSAEGVGLFWLSAGTQACADGLGPAQSHALCACWSDE